MIRKIRIAWLRYRVWQHNYTRKHILWLRSTIEETPKHMKEREKLWREAAAHFKAAEKIKQILKERYHV